MITYISLGVRLLWLETHAIYFLFYPCVLEDKYSCALCNQDSRLETSAIREKEESEDLFSFAPWFRSCAFGGSESFNTTLK